MHNIKMCVCARTREIEAGQTECMMSSVNLSLFPINQLFTHSPFSLPVAGMVSITFTFNGFKFIFYSVANGLNRISMLNCRQQASFKPANLAFHQ